MKTIFFYIALFFPLTIFSQQVTDPFKIGSNLINNGNYLGARDTVEKIKNDYYLTHHLQQNSVPPTLEDQAMAFFDSLIGENYTLNWKKSKLRARKDQNVNFSPAVPYIINACKDKQVIMINEDHNTPKHRIFTYNLLEELYHLGYRYLAVEALENDSSCVTLGFPQISSGFYTSEPNMGNMIKKALALGFKLVSYESKEKIEYKGESEYYLDNIREVNQATNLYTILKHDPRAKIIVHAGHGHIWEKGGDIIFMAEYFKIISGINPLTINQSINSMEEFTQKLDSSPQLVKTDMPYVVLDQENKPRVSNGDQIGDYDLLVTWPSPKYIHGRNDYMLSKQGAQIHLISIRKRDMGKLLQIRSLDPKNNIPIDQFLIKENIFEYAVALDKGQYYIQIVDKYGRITRKDKISIL